ncbi:hypothetical protein PoB_002406400 [Plakobranchus ocellatus]|uniref:Uncharacterized protein n=1 Tax=Plakobranchus ocellatus TaxID=259542 RepID=A0AAV3ZQF4_9GAST|nr:hypothetical protein PoB_002406400 [Plakobranchus ocellatus]
MTGQGWVCSNDGKALGGVSEEVSDLEIGMERTQDARLAIALRMGLQRELPKAGKKKKIAIRWWRGMTHGMAWHWGVARGSDEGELRWGQSQKGFGVHRG